MGPCVVGTKPATHGFFMLQVKVLLNLRGLKKFTASLSTNSPAVVKTLKQWGVRYRGFVQRRFDTFSKGGGNWPPLKPATIARRRKGPGQGTIAILRDTGTVFRALNPVLGQPGSFEEIGAQPFSVVLGFGGAAVHPNGKATIADIASFHNSGAGNLPRRQIIVMPSPELLRDMAADAQRNLSKQANADTK